MRGIRRNSFDQTPAGQGGSGSPSVSLLPDRERRIAISLRMLELQRQGHFRALAPLLTEDCIFRIGGMPKATPISGTWIGLDQVLEGMRVYFTHIEIVDIISIEFIVDGDNVVAPWKSQMRNRGTGPSKRIGGISYLRFRRGRICEYTTQMDTASLSQMTDRFGDDAFTDRQY